MIKNLKIFLISLMSVWFLGLALSPTTSAFSLFGDACNGNTDSSVCNDAKNNDNPIYGPNGIVKVVVNILSIIIGVAAVIILIIAGIQYMLSTGDPTKVNNAKNAILYALIGLMVAVAAQVIVRFVVGKL
jgi:hypothetical protein